MKAFEDTKEKYPPAEDEASEAQDETPEPVPRADRLKSGFKNVMRKASRGKAKSKADKGEALQWAPADSTSASGGDAVAETEKGGEGEL